MVALAVHFDGSAAALIADGDHAAIGIVLGTAGVQGVELLHTANSMSLES